MIKRILFAVIITTMVAMLSPVQAIAGGAGSKTIEETGGVKARMGVVDPTYSSFDVNKIHVRTYTKWNAKGRFQKTSIHIWTQDTQIGIMQGFSAKVVEGPHVMAQGPGGVRYQAKIQIMRCVAYVTNFCPIQAYVYFNTTLVEPASNVKWTSRAIDGLACANKQCRLFLKLGEVHK